MKKILALVLCLVTVLGCMTGCEFDFSEKKQEDRGATIQLYMSSELYSFDPAQAYIDDAAQQVLGLMYEGLFTLGKDGSRVKAGCKSYKIVDNERNHYIEITIRKSFWSDGRQVQAQDYVFAFKRAIETESTNEAAAMLMDIKNAYNIKHAAGDKPLSIDDLGVTDVGTNVLKIEFEETIDYEQFLDYLASPLLVPLREDVVNRAEQWASNSSIIVCNGPFFIRTFDPGEGLVLERNSYYNRDPEDDSIKKAVTPYRLKIDFKKNAEENLTAFLNGEIEYIAELPIEARTSQAGQIQTVKTNSMSQMTLLFNTEDELLADAKVRKALSMALSRSEIAKKVVFAKPATGVVASGVFETTAKAKKMFSEVSGTLFAPDANVDGAKALLKEAGVSKGTITVTYRNTAADAAVFEYVKGVWEGLGFKVEGNNKLDFTAWVDKNEYDQRSDDFYEAYKAGDYQVMIYDMLMSSTDPFSVLAPFAKDFSGNKIELSTVGNIEAETEAPETKAPETKVPETAAPETGDAETGAAETDAAETNAAETEAVETEAPETKAETEAAQESKPETEAAEQEEAIEKPHVSGFDNDKYNELIAKAFAIKEDNAERAALLHEAEKLLAEECPIAPLVEYQKYYMISGNLSGYKTAVYGIANFNKVNLKTYKPEEEK